MGMDRTHERDLMPTHFFSGRSLLAFSPLLDGEEELARGEPGVSVPPDDAPDGAESPGEVDVAPSVDPCEGFDDHGADLGEV